MTPRTVAFVGDTHCGSHVGLWPVSELPADTSRHIGCRYLMQCWEHFVKTCPPLDLLVLMGDMIDGKQHKSSGTGLFTTDLGEQAEGCVNILKPLVAKSKQVIRVWGTAYHESFDNVLGIIDKAFNVAKVAQVINLKLGDHVLNIAHHPASGAAIYQGTVADRETLWSKLAAYDKKLPDCRWMVRAHKHNYYLWDVAGRTMVGMPCWQLATAHAIKVNLWRFQPTLGAMLMVADEQEDGGYRFKPRLYDSPPGEVFTL